MAVSSKRHTDNSTLRSIHRFTSTRLLDNLIHVDGSAITAKIFRTLQTGIRGSHTKEAPHNLSIAGATTSLLLVEFLNLESKAELIDSCNSRITRIKSPKIIRDDLISRTIKLTICSNNAKRRILSSWVTNSTTIASISTQLIYLSSPLLASIIKSSSIGNKSQTNTTGIRDSIRLSNNRIRTSSTNRNSHIRSFLRSRKGRCKIIVVFAGDVR